MQASRDIYKELYFHSVRSNFNYLIEILNSGYILSRRGVHHQNSDVSFSGDNYISLSKYQYGIEDIYYCEDGYEKKSSFNAYVVEKEGIILANISCFPTLYMSYSELYTNPCDEFIRFSEFDDEYQVKDCISLAKMVGIFYPIKKMMNTNNGIYHDEMKKINDALKTNHYNIKIVDSSIDQIDKDLDSFYKTLQKKL